MAGDYNTLLTDNKTEVLMMQLHVSKCSFSPRNG